MAQKKFKVEDDIRNISTPAGGLVDYKEIQQLNRRAITNQELTLGEIGRYFLLKARLYESAARYMESFNFRAGSTFEKGRDFYITPRGKSALRFRRKSSRAIEFLRSNPKIPTSP